MEYSEMQRKTRTNFLQYLLLSYHRQALVLIHSFILIIGIVFLVYANNIETDIPCWSDGNIASPIPISDDFADVAKSFQVTLQGCGITPFASIILLALSIFHLQRASFTKARLYSTCNLCVSLASLGFLIALFVFRLRLSGVLCSEAPFLV